MTQPLADTLRPQSIDAVIGQDHLVGDDGLIAKILTTKKVPSMIFWGPPATGKTTLAHIIGNEFKADMHILSAVMDGKTQLKTVIAAAEKNKLNNVETILFIDEIHRWNKAQQDALLPFVEHGDIILIGATTENPSFSVNSALLSRLQVITFEQLNIEDITLGLQRAYTSLAGKKPTKKEVSNLKHIAQLSDHDIRFAINTLEQAWNISHGKLSEDIILQAAQKNLLYDPNGEEHYNLISAVHKSLRSSNPTASTYWVVRMLESGADPLYIARRLLRFASEDIGNGNPNALLLANQVYETVQKLGLPECNTALIQLTQYLADSPKNNSAYTAYKEARRDVKKHGTLPVPLNIRNAPTKLMKNLGYGKGYEYDHNLENKKSDQRLLPPELDGQDYYS